MSNHCFEQKPRFDYVKTTTSGKYSNPQPDIAALIIQNQGHVTYEKYFSYGTSNQL